MLYMSKGPLAEKRFPTPVPETLPSQYPRLLPFQQARGETVDSQKDFLHAVCVWAQSKATPDPEVTDCNYPPVEAASLGGAKQLLRL